MDDLLLLLQVRDFLQALILYPTYLFFDRPDLLLEVRNFRFYRLFRLAAFEHLGLTYALQSLDVDLVQLIRFVHLVHQFLKLAVRFLKLCLLRSLVYFDLLGFNVLLMHLFFLEVNDVLESSFLSLILGKQRLGFVNSALLHSLDRVR